MIFTRQSGTFLSIFVVALLSCSLSYSQTVKNSKYKGMQISRTDLVNSLSGIDSLLHFKETPAKGAPKLIAKGSFAARVEITGTEDNVLQAQWTVSQPANGTLSKLAFTRMAFFVNLLAQQQGAAWFFQQTFTYNQNPNNPISNVTMIDSNRVMFIYDPSKKTFIITITSE